MNTDENIISEKDLVEALNGEFLNKMKEFAWRGKEAKMPDTPNEEMHSFRVILAFDFKADSEDKAPLTFDKIGSYRFSLNPFTNDDIEKMLKEPEASLQNQPEEDKTEGDE